MPSADPMQSPYQAALGKTYISVSEVTSTPALTSLDEAEAAALSAIIDRLIPGDLNWPSASSTDCVAYVDQALAHAPELRPSMLAFVAAANEASVELAGGPFVSVDAQVMDEILTSLETSEMHSPAFSGLYAFTIEAYYRDPRVVAVVQARTGYDTNRPLTDSALPPFDESLLDRVRSLPPKYRHVEEPPKASL